MEKDIDRLKELLNAECTYRMKDETMDMFLGLMTEVKLKKNEPLIPYGKFDNNVYIVKSGIFMCSYFDGMQEETFGFALPGTVIISFYPYYKHEPSFFQMQSCGRSVAMKVTKADIDKLMDESHDFTRWMLSIFAAQLYHYEKRFAVINGFAKERLETLLKNRPEIMETVPQKVIASYIGITPSSLSRLKRQIKATSESKR